VAAPTGCTDARAPFPEPPHSNCFMVRRQTKRQLSHVKQSANAPGSLPRNAGLSIGTTCRDRFDNDLQLR
jgi:hypothetical protein